MRIGCLRKKCDMALKLRRTTNFSEEERLLVAELGKEFPVIENKAYDNKTLGKKTKAWEAILSRYNSVNPGGIKRDLNQLQGCWRRLKIQTKKEFDTHRRESRKTGGGKAPMSPSQVCKVVADVIPTSVNPLHNEFDDDALVVLSGVKMWSRRRVLLMKLKRVQVVLIIAVKEKRVMLLFASNQGCPLNKRTIRGKPILH